MRTTVEELPADRRSSHGALVAAVRELNLVAGTTQLAADQLAETTAAVRELTCLLAEKRGARVMRSGFVEPRRRAAAGDALQLHVLNPALLGMTVVFDHDTDGAVGVQEATNGGDPTGLTARAELTVDALHEGPSDSVHGGILAFLMDCVLGVLVQATGTMSVTGTLDLRYLRRTPLEQPIVLGARVVRRDGRKLTVEGWVEHDGVRTVASRGLFVAVEAPAHAGT